MNLLSRRKRPSRTKIELNVQSDLRGWTKALGVAPNDLKRIIDKVGNSVAAVRKEIEHAATRL